MPTLVSEYRKDKRKLVTLSSGFVFEIRKMTVPVMMEMTKLLQLEIPEGTPVDRVREVMEAKTNDPAFKENVIKAVDYVIPRCVTSPQIVNASTPSENALSLDEIAPGDLFELFAEITDFSGVGEMAQSLREKFRIKSTG